MGGNWSGCDDEVGREFPVAESRDIPVVRRCVSQRALDALALFSLLIVTFSTGGSVPFQCVMVALVLCSAFCGARLYLWMRWRRMPVDRHMVRVVYDFGWSPAVADRLLEWSVTDGFLLTRRHLLGLWHAERAIRASGSVRC